MSRLLVFLLLTVFLSACGNKGALYLPETEDSNIEQSTTANY